VRRGDAVRVLHRASSSLMALEGLDVEHAIGDILDTEAVGRAAKGCDLVFHVAALSSYWRARRADIYRSNVEGTRAVMEACLGAGVRRVVHTSSVAAIGVRPDGSPADETTPFDALSSTFAYADSKHRAEAEVQHAIGLGLDAVIVNPAIVLGAGDHYMVSGSMIVELARGRVPATPPGGACMVDVDAVVQGHLAAAECGRTGERYILGGENLTHRKVAETIAEVVGRKPPALRLPRWVIGPTARTVDLFNRVSSRPPMITGEQLRMSGLSIYFDSHKAVQELGYSLLPFRGSVEKAYRWYHEHDYC
jgi:dihydroflavonol-4-reductase